MDEPCSIQLGSLIIDLVRSQVLGGPQSVSLTAMEVGLLRRLAEGHGETIPRETLLQDVWGQHPNVVSRALDTTVRRLRKKLGEPARRPRFLLTVHGEGYRLVTEDASDDLMPEQSRAVEPEWREDPSAMVAAVYEASKGEVVAAAVRALRTVARVPDREAGLTLLVHLRSLGLPVESLTWVEAEALWALPQDERERQAPALVRRCRELSLPKLLVRVLLLCAVGTRRQRWLKEAVQLAEEVDELCLVAEAKGQLATTLHVESPVEAHRLYMEALDAASNNAPYEEAFIQSNFAALLLTLDELDVARERLLASRALFEARGDNKNVGWLCIDLGFLAQKRFRLSEALGWYIQASQRLQEPQAALTLLGLRIDLGESPSIELAESLLTQARKLQQPMVRLVALTMMGLTWAARGNLVLARAPLEAAQELSAEVATREVVAVIEGELAALDYVEGRTQEAVARLKRAIQHLMGTTRHRLTAYRFLRAWKHHELGDEVAFGHAMEELDRGVPADLPELRAWLPTVRR